MEHCDISENVYSNVIGFQTIFLSGFNYRVRKTFFKTEAKEMKESILKWFVCMTSSVNVYIPINWLIVYVMLLLR